MNTKGTIDRSSASDCDISIFIFCETMVIWDNSGETQSVSVLPVLFQLMDFRFLIFASRLTSS